jgi:hypothetical protein
LVGWLIDIRGRIAVWFGDNWRQQPPERQLRRALDDDLGVFSPPLP